MLKVRPQDETTKVPLAFPLGGVNRNLPRSFQPPGTAWDALNVLPYDRYGRARGGQRPGTGKLWQTAIGAPNGPVQLLKQATVALDPSVVTAGTQQAIDNFTFANGNLSAVDTNWVTYTGAPPTTDATRLVVASNKVRSGLTFANPGYGLYQPTVTLGQVYIVRMTITPGAIAAQQIFRVFARMNKGAPTSTAVTCHLTLDAVTSTTSAATCKIYLTTDITSASGTGLGTFTFPANAFNSATSYTLELQVNGDICHGLINGIPYVSLTTATNSGQVGIGFSVQAGAADALCDDWTVFTGTQLAVYRQNNIVAVDGGDIYVGDISTQATLAPGGTDALTSNGNPSAAALFNIMYFVDGFSTIKQLDLTTRIVSTPTITSGGATTETTTTLGLYQIAASWRGRLVLAADRTNPQNFAMSKVGNPTNFDYSATTADAAFAGNASTLGRIGDPITALIPYSDDVLIIGGDHTLWAVKGDPAAGGSIDLVSDAIGVLGKDAWCKTPEGVIYFVGTGGLFRMTPGGVPENVSSTKYNQFFAGINRATNYVTMAWDRDRQGCYVFITPVSTGTATHLWFDSRTDGGYWPLQFPNSTGPISTMVYDGDAPTDRLLLLGGREGYVMIMSTGSRRDETSSSTAAISSYVFLGPIQQFPPDGEAVIISADMDAGELFTTDQSDPTRWNLNVTMYGSNTAYEVTEGTPKYSDGRNFGTDGYMQVWYPRIRGRWLSVKVSNSNDGDYWTFERLVLTLRRAGTQR